MPNDNFQEVFNKIDSYDFSRISTKYQQVHETSEKEAVEVLEELKKWFTLCAVNPGRKYHIGSRIDDMWHVFILFTKDYAEFCEQRIGFFLHHEPSVPGESLPPSKDDANDELLNDYVVHFNQKPPMNIWPKYHKGPNENCTFRPCHCIYMPR